MWHGLPFLLCVCKFHTHRVLRDAQRVRHQQVVGDGDAALGQGVGNVAVHARNVRLSLER